MYNNFQRKESEKLIIDPQPDPDQHRNLIPSR